MVSVVTMWEVEEGVNIKVRDGNQTQIRYHKFHNYFYIKQEDYQDVAYILDPRISDMVPIEDKDGELFYRCYLKNNFHRNMVRNEIEELGVATYEADIPAHKRLLIDNSHLSLEQEGLRIAWLDIETYDLKGFVKDKKDNILPEFPILSIAVKEFLKDKDVDVWYSYNEGLDGSEFDEYRILRKSYLDNPTKEKAEQLEQWSERVDAALLIGERALLYRYFDFVKQYDVISAYNGIRFDDLMIRGRAKLHGLDYDGLRCVNFDYMECYKKNKYEPIKSYALNNVAYEELKGELDKEESSLTHPEEIKKVDWKEKTNAKKVFDLFVCYPEILKEYNIQDVQLLDMLEKKLNFFKLHMVQARISHCLLLDTLHNSKICDYLTLNEYKRQNIIRPSKPNEFEVNERENEIPPGGFVRAFMPGLHWNVYGIDFKSQYPTNAITYNISPDTYLRSIKPDLTRVFTPDELDFITYAIDSAKKYIDKTNKLEKKKYEENLEVRRATYPNGMASMEELMWKFTEKYDNNVEVKENECFTPADINYDTRGWNIHPHYVFRNDIEGVYPKLYKELLVERDKVKYSLKNFEYGSFKWQEAWDYQLGLKILANSLYGYLGFRGSRDYKYELATAVTTSSRYTTKRSIIKAREQGWEVTHCDTDGIYVKGDIEIDKLNEMYYDFFNEFIKPFNTSYRIDLKNPKTGEMEKANHFIVFEYEKTLEGLIVVKKKRYYYKVDGRIEGVGGYMKRSDTNQLGSDLQKELLQDILGKNYDREKWLKKITELKDMVFNYKLEEKHIIKVQAISKPIEEYGKPVIDGKTGLNKIKKDGTFMFSPIPANVKIAKKMIEQGEIVEVGDKIPFIVLKDKPITPITIEEYRQMTGHKYCAKYYYTRIIKPIIEIMAIVYQEDTFGEDFGKLWLMTNSELQKYKNTDDDEDNEEE